MFYSTIAVKDLIEELSKEADIAPDIPAAAYVQWLNSLQQLLYTEVIKEQKKVTLSYLEDSEAVPAGFEPQQDFFTGSPVYLSSLPIAAVENKPRFEDIYAVYADKKQLKKSTVASGAIFPDTFYKEDNNLGFNTSPLPSELTIVYFVRPALITVNEEAVDDSKVMIPAEFIDLVKAKLRGEAYKLANEDSLAAKWLNDYNVLLETFKLWVSGKSPDFGL